MDTVVKKWVNNDEISCEEFDREVQQYAADIKKSLRGALHESS